MKRPKSLKETAVLSQTEQREGRAGLYLREFLDEFYSESDSIKREAMIAEEPPLSDKPHHNAYYAAVAEHLALRYKLKIPEWTQDRKKRFLKRAYFPCGLESLKATLIKESPVAFRRRMIFVDADPLYRPRRDYHGIGGEKEEYGYANQR